MSDARVHIDAQIQVRRDVEANWSSVDPLLRDGEIAYSKDTKRIKVGDGRRRWSELEYLITDNLELNAQFEALLARLVEAEKITKLFFVTEDEQSIGTKYNLFSEREISSGGAATEGSGGGEGGTTTGEYKMYIYPQSEPAMEWVIDHGLNKMPNVKIVDSSGELVYGDVKYESMGVVVVTFGAAFSGTAYLD